HPGPNRSTPSCLAPVRRPTRSMTGSCDPAVGGRRRTGGDHAGGRTLAQDFLANPLMHELSLALNILDVVAKEAEQRGGVRVLGIYLKLGPLAGVVKEALLSAYEIARVGSSLEGAELVIEEVPVMAYCPTCGTARALVSVQQLCCIECGTPAHQLVSGRELEVVALEIQ